MEMGGSISLILLLILVRHSEILLLRGNCITACVCAVCLSRLGKLLIHFFLVGEELLDARALQHALEMRGDVGEA